MLGRNIGGVSVEGDGNRVAGAGAYSNVLGNVYGDLHQHIHPPQFAGQTAASREETLAGEEAAVTQTATNPASATWRLRKPKTPRPPTAVRRPWGRRGVAVLAATTVVALVVGTVIWATENRGHGTTSASSSPPPTPTASPSPTPFDPKALDSKTTDQTPFTEAALLPPTFTALSDDDHRTEFTLSYSGGAQPCVIPGTTSSDPLLGAGVSPNVQNVLTTNGCISDMAGVYLGPGDGGASIGAFVEVYQFADAATAQRVHTNLNGLFAPGAGGWSFGFRCPPTGAAAAVCTHGNSGYTASLNLQHRYVVKATTIYTEGKHGVDSATNSAAKAAVLACGPNYYKELMRRQDLSTRTPSASP
ncbi:hypothetical protein [Streptomyces sp. NBC_00391]|uniref:hypothetical protein n=1 Tax=Streptomyces sp. NBC_00391 TaxID=2903647 RepID=UPI002E249A30